MSMTNRNISENELHAYVDDELDTLRVAEIEQQLEQNPEIAAEVETYQGYNEALHALFDPVLEEKVPERVFPAIKPVRQNGHWARAASVIMAVAVGVLLGWVTRGEFLPDSSTRLSKAHSIVNDAFNFHTVYTAEVRHPVEVGVEQQDHLIKWLSKRLHTKVQAPSLQVMGYELLGGRLLTTADKPAAQFMYQNAEGNRLTLFLRQRIDNETQAAFQYASHGTQNGFYWIDGELSFVLIGEISKAEVSKAAHYVYEDLNR